VCVASPHENVELLPTTKLTYTPFYFIVLVMGGPSGWGRGHGPSKKIEDFFYLLLPPIKKRYSLRLEISCAVAIL
jgi:hypothetical protein